MKHWINLDVWDWAYLGVATAGAVAFSVIALRQSSWYGLLAAFWIVVVGMFIGRGVDARRRRR